MKRSDAEILFALYMQGGQASMSWLMEFLGDDGESHRAIKNLISTKLMTLGITDQQVFASLTENGKKMAVAAAGFLSEIMISQWRQTRTEIPAG